MKAILALVATLLVLPVYAEDWKTTDGIVYKDVKVIKVEDDAVTIFYADGGARVDLVNLPPDLQKRFNYDPVKAKAAADKRAQDDAASDQALQKEMDQTARQKLQKQIEEQKRKDLLARQAAGTNNTTGAPSTISTSTTTVSTPTTSGSGATSTTGVSSTP